MRIRSTMRGKSAIAVATLVAMGTLIAPGMVVQTSAQTSEYFLLSGDQGMFTVVRNGTIQRQWAVASGTNQYQYPIAVRDTVRTMGADVGAIGAEYRLTGTDLNTRYTHPDGTSRCWDGATDGVHNYSIDTIGHVYQFNLDWTDPVFLFSAGGLGGLTYDPSNSSLWVGLFSSSTMLTDYSMAGAVLSSFSTGHDENMAVAMDYADGTLWIHNRNAQGTIEQWSRNGQMLNSIAVHGLDSQNALGGEFAFTSGGGYSCSLSGSCPGTIQVSWSGAPANTQQGILFAGNTGHVTIPSGPCQGTQLGLGNNQLRLVNTVGTGASGTGMVNGQASNAACGGYIQLVAVGNPCKTSNVAELP